MDEDFIGFILKDWYVFDSFAPFQIEWRGLLYPTAEHAYQAAHFSKRPELAEQVRMCRSPKAAQELANKYSDQDDPDWKEKKLAIMEEILRHKLDQHPYIREILVSTGNKQLVETSCVCCSPASAANSCIDATNRRAAYLRLGGPCFCVISCC